MSQRRAKGPKPQLPALRCPYCRAVVLFDDARRVTSHQAPICRGWDDFMKSLPGVTELGPELLEGGDERPES